MEASLFLIVILSLFVAFVFLIYILSPLITPKALKLNGSHVIVTGGSSGIGKAVAVEAAKQGASVTILARNQVRLKQAKQEIENHMKDKSVQKIFCISVDVAKDYSAVEKAIQESVEAIGPCDMLVNSAGISHPAAFDDISIADFKNMMDVNFFGSVYLTKAVLPYMKKRNRGRIVFISSQAGQVGLYGFTSYSSAKFALRGFAEALQMEVKPYNIYLTLNCPPDTDTPMLQKENETKPKETRLISESAGLYKPEDVAKTIIADSKNAVFLSWVGLDGYLLAIMTCGMSPITSLMEGVQQVAFMGLCRFISLFYLSSFDKITQRCKEEREKEAAQSHKDN